MGEPGTPPDSRPSAARPFLVLSLCSAAAALALGTATVPLRIGEGIDEAGFGRVSRRDEAMLYHATHRFLDGISSVTLAVIAVAAVVIALRRRRPALAVAAIAIVLGSNLTAQALKVLTERRIVGDPWDQVTAFPSGHATVVLSLVMALVLVVPPRWRWTATVTGGLFTALVSGALLAVNWHRPSEIVGAYLIVAAWAGAVVAAVVVRDGGVALAGPDSGDTGMRLAGVAGAVAIAVVLVTLPVADVYAKVAAREGFGAAAAVCGGVGIGLLSVTSVLLQRASAAVRPRAPRGLRPARVES